MGTQRFWCKHCHQTFQREYRYNACQPGMHDHILDQTMNGSGVRDIGRSSQVSTGTVLSTMKAIKDGLVQVNQALLKKILVGASGCEVEMFCACELDEQWSFIQNTGDQRWLWHALDRATNTVLASVLGPRTDAVVEELYT